MNMYKKVSLLYIVSFVFSGLIILLSACVSTGGEKTPPWVANIEAVYPGDIYIAQRGYGADRQSAEMAGIAAISRFFSTHIDTRSHENILVTDQGSSSQIDSNTFVQSQTELFAVHYTDPWFNEGTGGWETVAYIDRDEAWAIYEPKVRQKADTFRDILQSAEFSHEPLKQTFLYSKAQSSSIDLLSLIDFSEALYPSQAIWFDDIRTSIAQLSVKIANAKSLTSIFIECSVDFDASIYSAASQVFNSIGFPIETKKDNASYICIIEIEENIKGLDAGTFFYPTINISINNKNNVLFAYNRTLNRTGASNPDVAKRRAYTAMANEIQKSFYEELGRIE